MKGSGRRKRSQMINKTRFHSTEINLISVRTIEMYVRCQMQWYFRQAINPLTYEESSFSWLMTPLESRTLRKYAWYCIVISGSLQRAFLYSSRNGNIKTIYFKTTSNKKRQEQYFCRSNRRGSEQWQGSAGTLRTTEAHLSEVPEILRAQMFMKGVPNSTSWLVR